MFAVRFLVDSPHVNPYNVAQASARPVGEVGDLSPCSRERSGWGEVASSGLDPASQLVASTKTPTPTARWPGDGSPEP